jgi:3',5'-cyclic AMP phosphodiesterase CpdA
VRIAHLSDLHALALDGVSPLEFINKRILGYANLRLGRRRDKHPVHLFETVVDEVNRAGYDHVVVTGDLTNLSLAPEFALARRLLDTLELGPAEVTVVPGNHDVYTWSALQAGLFAQVMQPYATSDDEEEVSFPFVRVRGPLAIFGVSTAFPSPPPFADGWVGRAQLAALEDKLKAHEGKFRVLLLHHPPYTNRHSFLRGLRDRNRLQAVLARTGCELVLHGHEHRDLRHELRGPNGVIPVIGVGSGTYDHPGADRRARYNVYRIEERRLIEVTTYVFEPDSRRFVSQAVATAAVA